MRPYTNQQLTSLTVELGGFVLHHAKALGSPAMVWAVLLLWLADEKGLQLERHAKRLLETELIKLMENATGIFLKDLELLHAKK